MDFEQAWDYLSSLQMHTVKLGLESMSRFLVRLGSPEQGLDVVHVAGTNGKGSVGAAVAAMLAAAGLSCGHYTSPHLTSVRERFAIGGRFMSEEDFARGMTRIRDLLGDDRITYFEATTALALWWFARRQVDMAVLEVGMGGRLDATNVVRPRVAVITNVSLDHQHYLGESIAAVAREKAGIVKPGVPVVSGCQGEAARVVEEACSRGQAPLLLAGRDFTARRTGPGRFRFQGLGRDLEDLPLALAGGYQAANMGLAVACALVLAEQGLPLEERHVRGGLAAVRWPGRLERLVHDHGPEVGERTHLLDGAHNPAGAAALCQALEEDFAGYDRLVLIWAAMADKDLGESLNPVARGAEAIILTRPDSERAASPRDLLKALEPGLRHRARMTATAAEALEEALQLSAPQDLILTAGSLYLVGEIRHMLTGSLAGEDNGAEPPHHTTS